MPYQLVSHSFIAISVIARICSFATWIATRVSSHLRQPHGPLCTYGPLHKANEQKPMHSKTFCMCSAFIRPHRHCAERNPWNRNGNVLPFLLHLIKFHMEFAFLWLLLLLWHTARGLCVDDGGGGGGNTFSKCTAVPRASTQRRTTVIRSRVLFRQSEYADTIIIIVFCGAPSAMWRRSRGRFYAHKWWLGFLIKPQFMMRMEMLPNANGWHQGVAYTPLCDAHGELKRY